MMPSPLVITFGGGKGGIGKSTLCCNIAAVLGARGMRVCLVDADLGGANLHTLCGIKNPEATAYVKRLRPGSAGGSYISVDEMVDALMPMHPEVARTMRERLRLKQIFLVLNMVHERGDIDAGKRFTELAKTYLSITATYIGYVIWEPGLRGAVREGVPFMHGTQASPVRACFETIADNLVALTTKES